MDFISSAIFGGMLYDGLKVYGSIGVDYLKNRLKDWVFDDETINELASKVNDMDLSLFNEKGVQKRLEESKEVMELLKKIKSNSKENAVTQIHYGSGDNVAGNKVVKSK